MNIQEFEQRLNDVWLTAYNNGLNIAHNIFIRSSNEVKTLEDHAEAALKHAEAVTAGYKALFETYVEKMEGKK